MNDPEVPDDLKRLYTAAPADEPPAALDAAVLAHARREVEAAVASGRRPWGPPLALAAVLVLTVSLVVVMEREQHDIASVAGIAPPARDLALAPAAKQEAAEAASPPVHDVARESTARDRQPHTEQPARDDARPIAPPLTEHAAERTADRVTEAAAPERRSDVAPSASSTAGAASALSVEKSSAEPFPRAPSAVAPPRAPAFERQAAGAAVADAASNSGRVAALRAAPAEESPEAWLRRLAVLKQQGRLKEFEEGLAGFRKRHPSYAIPETLVPAK